MAIFVFEFNDAGISISKDGELLLESPGYAVLDGAQLYLGNEAQDIARIRPRWTNNRFWSALNMESMPGATPQVRHHADLAFAHLQSIWKQVGEADSEAVFAVPGHWSAEQLGLLLGIAQEAGLSVRCMVDAAVAAAAVSQPEGISAWHLDISLHRIVLSELSGGDTLERRRLFVLAEEGLVHFNNLWANTIADQFVQATRFDPMHRAETEQQLHDRLPTCLAELEDHGAAVVALEDGGKHYSVTIRRDQLIAAAASAYPRILQQLQLEAGAGKGESALLLSERFSGFPGLRDALAVLQGMKIKLLEPAAAARGCMRIIDLLRSDDEEVRLHTAVPRGEEKAEPPREAARPMPTHLLYRGQAWALGAQPLILALGEAGLHPNEEDGAAQCAVHRLDGRVWLEPRPVTRVALNGREVDDKVTLDVGDALSFDGHDEPVQVISLSS